jgi:uncharacterized protein with GYD domain
MPTYIMLANWTDQGARNAKESPRRLNAAKKALSDMGGEFSRHSPDSRAVQSGFVAEWH